MKAIAHVHLFEFVECIFVSLKLSQSHRPIIFSNFPLESFTTEDQDAVVR